ncbi:MAG: LytR/AlgR family response regulator transcription factor [Blautia sp.]|jgi:DNA-binding LytR/AlgR family response regulator
MTKIAICDDETDVQKQMAGYLAALSPLIQTDCYGSGEELLSSGITYDILFLDIDMKGMSGIDTARRLRLKDKKAKIIYVTAYEDFQSYAFSVHAFGYLIKPVQKEQILSLLKEALDYTEEEINGPKIRLQTEEGYQELLIKDIYYFEYQNRRIKGVTTSGTYHLSGTISALGDKMMAFGFGIPHKSFVVNLNHLKNIKGYDLYLTNGSILPLSQKKSVQFREQLAQWLAQQI